MGELRDGLLRGNRKPQALHWCNLGHPTLSAAWLYRPVPDQTAASSPPQSVPKSPTYQSNKNSLELKSKQNNPFCCSFCDWLVQSEMLFLYNTKIVIIFLL